jgi:hypothetical protein
VPKIKFSEDLEKMLCITRNGSVYIFKKSRDKKPDDDDEDKVPERLWRVQSVINDIHNSILERSNELFIFDPTFEFYFNVMFNSSSFVIYRVCDKQHHKNRSSEVFKKIDTKFFSIELNGEKSTQSIQRIASRMQMLDHERIRIVSG